MTTSNHHRIGRRISCGIALALCALFAAACGVVPQRGADTSFSYQVRVLSQADTAPIERASVTLDVANQAPLSAFSDSTGLARIAVSGDYAGKPGRLMVKAQDYTTYIQNIDLAPEALPAEIQLVSAPAALAPSSDPAASPVPTNAPEPAATPAPTAAPSEPTAALEPTATAAPTAAPEPFSATIAEVEYRLVEAGFAGSELTFWFTALNSGADKQICLRFSSSLIDQSGTPHKRAYFTDGANSGLFDCFNVDLPYNVPVRFGAVFTTVAPSATTIPLLEVVLGGEGSIELRDVPLPFEGDATPAAAAPTAPGSAAVTSSLKDVDYELVEAGFANGELLFWFKATNRGADKTICLRFSSSLIDQSGTPHKRTYFTDGTNSGLFDCFNVDLPNGVPVRFGVAFTTLSPSTTTIPLLEVVVGGEGTIQLRDVPIPYRA